MERCAFHYNNKFYSHRKLLEHWIWDEFETSPPMSTYLVAIILTELSPVVTSYTSIDGRNVTIRLWAREHLANQLEFALDFVPKVLVDKALVASTIVHEIAHQWFGNLVTSRWWDDIWLNEGLTTLFESMFTRQVRDAIKERRGSL